MAIKTSISSILFSSKYHVMSQQPAQQSFEGWTPAQIQEYYSKWQEYYNQVVCWFRARRSLKELTFDYEQLL
jgi:hypothetical protein